MENTMFTHFISKSDWNRQKSTKCNSFKYHAMHASKPNIWNVYLLNLHNENPRAKSKKQWLVTLLKCEMNTKDSNIYMTFPCYLCRGCFLCNNVGVGWGHKEFWHLLCSCRKSKVLSIPRCSPLLHSPEGSLLRVVCALPYLPSN